MDILLHNYTMQHPPTNNISNKYSVSSVISRGVYGTVCIGSNIRTNEKVAIKMGPITDGSIKYEAKIIQYLSGLKGFATFKWFGVYNNNHYLVTNLLGIDLNVWANRPPTPSLQQVLDVGVKMIGIISVLHRQSLVHRDIKPGNFLFGNMHSDSADIHLIDFGFCKKYTNSYGDHVDNHETTALIGTPNFVSMNVHLGSTPSRRDDIESCIYVMLFMLYRNRLWFNCTNIDDIVQVKRALIHTDSISVNSIFINMLTHVAKMEYADTPDYTELALLCNLQTPASL